MLSRTADHLFWMARYIERAENTARMLNVNVETAMLPQPAKFAQQIWRATLSISELQDLFEAKDRPVNQKEVLDFMVRDPDNPSSITSCLRQARENAKAVRGVLTTEVWETHNTTWLTLQESLKSGLYPQDPGQFFEWVKYRSHLSRGVTLGTMLKDEALHFIRLGTFLERADNSARLIDVKFHGMPKGASAEHALESTPVDFYYWTSLLRSVSGFEIYRKVYRDVITPPRVAELLILHPQMPRSLLACMDEVVDTLAKLRNNTSLDTERLAGKLHAELKFACIEEIMDAGLHDYLTRFMEKIYEVGHGVSRNFLLPLNV
jgi:uncharacterized alpha-E superfamily protein